MLSDNAKRMIAEAKQKNMWLFDPHYKIWYSPENFAHTFTYANADDDFLKRLQIKHPREGIDAGFKRLDSLQSKLAAFVKSVNDYYNK